jgi:hypothetical protein
VRFERLLADPLGLYGEDARLAKRLKRIDATTAGLRPSDFHDSQQFSSELVFLSRLRLETD